MRATAHHRTRQRRISRYRVGTIMTATTLSKEALALSPDKRLQLACALIESVEGDDAPCAETAWNEEISERISRYDRGEAKSIPAAEVFRQLRGIAPGK